MTKAEWILSWPSGRFVRVCNKHMAQRAKGPQLPANIELPRCDELKWSPVRETPDCDDCKAGKP